MKIFTYLGGYMAKSYDELIEQLLSEYNRTEESSYQYYKELEKQGLPPEVIDMIILHANKSKAELSMLKTTLLQLLQDLDENQQPI